MPSEGTESGQEYVERLRARGYADNHIRGKLQDAGWTHAQIDRLLAAVGGTKTEEQQSEEGWAVGAAQERREWAARLLRSYARIRAQQNELIGSTGEIPPEICEYCPRIPEQRAMYECPYIYQLEDGTYDAGNCDWQWALLLQCLAEDGDEYRLVGVTEAPKVLYPHVYVETKNTVLTNDPAIWTSPEGATYARELVPLQPRTEQIEALKPSLIVLVRLLGGTKQTLIHLLRIGADVMCLDGDKIIEYDSQKQLDTGIDVAIDAIAQNLGRYCDAASGSAHDKHVEAFVRIGEDLGYLCETEFRIREIYVDCVWLDSEGIEAAVEVELSGDPKKDIVSTWEAEPGMAIIVTQAKTHQKVRSLMESAVLEALPHSLVMVNVGTGVLHLFEGQQIIHTRELEGDSST